jgi:sugar lactone lactonase YvrE
VDTHEDPDTSVIDPPVVDCSALPQPPYKGRRITAAASEDLAFDQHGYLIGSDMHHIWKSTHQGERTIFVPNIPFRAGLRALPSGAFVIADNTNGAIVRIEPDGTRYEVLTGLSYPNGIEVGPDGMVYFTEHGARRVWRLDPYTKEAEVISELSITNPNGLTFEPGYGALLIGGFSGVGAIYRLPIDKSGHAGTLEVWAKDIGTGYLDGMGVDVCGNVYIADYMDAKILRLPPDGSSYETIIDGYELQGANPYMPNFQWGSGLGGWDPGKLYIPEGNTGQAVYEVDLGIPSKPR